AHSPLFSNTQLPIQSCQQSEQKRKKKVLHGSGVEVRYLQTLKPLLGRISLYSSGDGATTLVFAGKKDLGRSAPHQQSRHPGSPGATQNQGWGTRMQPARRPTNRPRRI
ncbi:unnamed protein product, partial [Ectocarpus sp. 12 AP-2014]